MNDKTFFELLKNFIFEVYPIAKEALEKRVYYPPIYKEYPRLIFSDSRMPYIDMHGDKPKNISEVFRSYSGKPDIELEKYDSYLKCKNYIEENEYFSRIILFYEKGKGEGDLYYVKSFLINIIERYYLLNKNDNDNEDLLASIYSPLEYGAFNKHLCFEIAIPILFVNFDFDEYEIGENSCIRRISDDYHKARICAVNRSYYIPELVSSATHEFVLKQYCLDTDKGVWQLIFSCVRQSFYPIEIFDNFIIALKTFANADSGYAQILIYPQGWACSYTMDLPEIHGLSIKKYPRHFEDNYLLKPNIQTINSADIIKIGETFKALENCKHNKIKIACKRLKYSFMRENEEDSILDLIIGLEVLLSDDEKSEITHKLALRLSKLISLYRKDYLPMDVFKNIKKIYNARSKIVHGTHKSISQNRNLQKSETIIESSNYKDDANNYLRLLIQILLENNEYMDVKKIDEKMIVDTAPNN